MNKSKFTVAVVGGLFLFLYFFTVFKTARADTLINNWWPTENASVTGLQPFKALIDGKDVNDYEMFWQVDNGQLNPMGISTTDYPHKEAYVDLTNWTWNIDGHYKINFVAKDKNNNILGQKEVTIVIPQSNQNTPTPVNTPTPEPIKEVNAPTPVTTLSPPIPQPTPTQQPSVSQIASELYVDPENLNSSTNTLIQQKIASQPQARWFGNWNANVTQDVKDYTLKANYLNQTTVLVAYNIPTRDCGGFSGSNLNDATDYINWITDFAKGLTGKTIVILEPDALAMIDCLSLSEQIQRIKLLNTAVDALKNSGAKVYIDAGHPGWQSAQTMSNRLKSAGIGRADGFSLNVSNFITTTDNISYGNEISNLIGGKHFVIDTSRNGKGPTTDYQWCNPDGRALGERPTLSTGNNLVDAYLWIKKPGESDGNCNGGPAAGVFWESYALGLASRAKW